MWQRYACVYVCWIVWLFFTVPQRNGSDDISVYSTCKSVRFQQKIFNSAALTRFIDIFTRFGPYVQKRGTTSSSRELSTAHIRKIKCIQNYRVWYNKNVIHYQRASKEKKKKKTTKPIPKFRLRNAPNHLVCAHTCLQHTENHTNGINGEKFVVALRRNNWIKFSSSCILKKKWHRSYSVDFVWGGFVRVCASGNTHKQIPDTTHTHTPSHANNDGDDEDVDDDDVVVREPTNTFPRTHMHMTGEFLASHINPLKSRAFWAVLFARFTSYLVALTLPLPHIHCVMHTQTRIQVVTAPLAAASSSSSAVAKVPFFLILFTIPVTLCTS